MYIKEIKLNGFKSFAEKIALELDSSFTGIVGPNGSGKSNIVDAIKWVLGEQSIKSLRGSKNMTDIIFNGSASRNAASFANVSITFDNSDRKLNIDYNDVVIKRTVYKSGENEYFINNEKCRLKDITNLFLDSKSSKESFNIIPQNKIEQILSEKPEDRRIIFEDAAGVLKYRKRKEESLSKLSKTHDNIDRINLIINELSENLLPLEKASFKAREYKSALLELEEVEIALIAKDITTFNEELIVKRETKSILEDKLTSLVASSTTDNTEVEKLKLEIIKIDEKINIVSNQIFSISESLLELSNKKTLLTERNKYDKTTDDIKNNIINLKNKEGSIKTNISSLNLDINNCNDIKLSLENKITDLNNDFNKKAKERELFINDLNNRKKLLIETNNKIDILENNMNSLGKIPYSVKSIINNPTLRGIHNILGNLVNTNNEYVTMLDISLGSASNNIVTEDESCAKEAIEYLKSHNSGRATFYPLNIIKPKSIDPSTLREIQNIIGYVAIASELVSYDSKYYNIIMNQLGNIIVATNIVTAIQISKKINYRYRVVSLDGDMLHVGGMITGGSVKTNSSFISDKYELERLKNSIKNINDTIIESEFKVNNIEKEIEIIKNNIYNLNIETIKNNELVLAKTSLLNNLTNEYNMIKSEIDSLSQSSLDDELNIVIEKYYEEENKKLEYEKNLEFLKKAKFEINSNLSTLEYSLKNSNTENNNLINKINTLEVEITKLDLTLDTLLNRLSEEYSLGYERAKNEYILEIDENIAREKVTSLRRKIKSLGDINLGSIEEYDRISTRVNFLNKQKDDLTKSEEDLLNIINDMDEVMKDKFVKSFNNINNEFNRVFKQLFKGGDAHLELVDSNNVLESGINIIAVPPGKNLKPLSLLSGGERTLTAISLLFSIMNLEEVPFVILDEVESALDEANATIFGEYLNNYKNKTQLLVITHKKKTMEYLDKLYGVTMQESGVSKLVSVKLDK